jgi:hypothetical protein
MGGKSVLIRQAAVTVILAQVGDEQTLHHTMPVC